MILSEYVSSNFDGMLVISDTHGNFDAFSKARKFAESENYFLMSLGDLTDRDRQPYEVVESMYNMVYDGRAGFVIGNHDDKFRRAALGSKVKFSPDARQTLDDVGASRLDMFYRMYTFIMSEPMLSGMFHHFDDIVLVHGASHPSLWEGVVTLGNSARSRALYGEVTNEKDDEGYPVRFYNWLDEVPSGKTVIVGHDKTPVHRVLITDPMVVTNQAGGQVVFLDTGCGKGGFMSGAVILHDKGGFKLHEFKDFK